MNALGPVSFDAAHVDTLQATLKPTDSLVSLEQARQALSAPSGSRPRMYGLWFDGGSYQLVKLASVAALDAPQLVAQWLSGTTFADLVKPA